MRMGVALVLDQSQLADRRIGLAQAHSQLLRQSYRSLARPAEQLASVGNITAFGCTVVSITTRARSEGFIASVRVATARVSCNGALSLSSPMRFDLSDKEWSVLEPLMPKSRKSARPHDR
jgi:hypothetical protein